jgi:hypothetical protein
MFKQVYKPYFSEALQDQQGRYYQDCYSEAESHFSSAFSKLKYITSSDMHKQEVFAQNYWKFLRSNQTCLFCLARSPQYVLSCGHSLCDICLAILGTASGNIEYHYTINWCIFCKAKGSIEQTYKPPTCGVRALSIDSGSTRGVIALENLLLLQQDLGERLKLQDLFDFAVGTSVGK